LVWKDQFKLQKETAIVSGTDMTQLARDTHAARDYWCCQLTDKLYVIFLSVSRPTPFLFFANQFAKGYSEEKH
jgi:hypothetical protein